MKILFVDDDVLFREVIGRALTKSGHETTVATDGLDAIKKASCDQFDLLITDIFMPHKEGIEVIQEIKDIYPDIKIIAISSGGSAGYTSFLKIAETFGADAMHGKTVHPAQLLEKNRGDNGRQSAGFGDGLTPISSPLRDGRAHTFQERYTESFVQRKRGPLPSQGRRFHDKLFLFPETAFSNPRLTFLYSVSISLTMVLRSLAVALSIFCA